jgi:hypothetical protein
MPNTVLLLSTQCWRKGHLRRLHRLVRTLDKSCFTWLVAEVHTDDLVVIDTSQKGSDDELEIDFYLPPYGWKTFPVCVINLVTQRNLTTALTPQLE